MRKSPPPSHIGIPVVSLYRNEVTLIHIWYDLTIIDDWYHDHTREDLPVTMESTWETLHHRISRLKILFIPPYYTYNNMLI